MITCIVQARMGSTRLKGKVLKEVLGTPMILVTLKRLQKSRYIDKLVLATSVMQEDDVLHNTVSNSGFDVFRGDEHNVLKRYADCAGEHGGDTIIRITGDCPLIDPVIVDHVITYFKMYNYDYVRLDVPDTFCRGFDVEVFSADALFRTCKLAHENAYTEHVTYYMYTHKDEFSVGVVRGNELYCKQYRLCVDTPEDFRLVSEIFEHFNDIYISSGEIVRFLDDHPEVARINQNIEQKKL